MIDRDFSDLERRFDRSRGSRSRRRRSKRRHEGTGRRGEGDTIEALVVSRSRRNARVRAGGTELVCHLRGELSDSRQPLVGDRALVRPIGSGEGVIEEILPRRNTLERVAEDDPGKVRVIAANVDTLIAVLAVEPFPPRWALADRLLVVAEREEIDGAIVVNKIDTLDLSGIPAAEREERRREVEEGARVYRDLGVRVLFTSAVEGTGLPDLRELIRDRISVLSGHSGVGKSSLLNALHPGWSLAVGDVNPQTGKGRHTTTSARLLPVPFGGHVVDTPGFREFGLGHVEPADLGRLYREFRPIIGGCRFTDCLHREEPGCALREAVAAGRVSQLRYRNYLQILHGLLAGGGRGTAGSGGSGGAGAPGGDPGP